jgi:hypothetical protein
MTRHRQRRQAIREARRVREGGADAGAAMRLAVMVAMVLIALAVAAGFQGERLATAVAGAFSGLEPLTRPVLLGASLLELGAAAVILLIAGVLGWRAFRR